ncbi:winged helix-turn-helix domain-containing protein [Nocardioides alkalitolerans]|uniref:winged helix-turn-helix domain-containing protein n=1 Tax=Nocardioides alkalitolerans TaxID=281714 RepID=UPI00040860D0|nr:crosslink repair DNA glycosylase YcaQ family protein [Nocardioides alkalitolerans]
MTVTPGPRPLPLSQAQARRVALAAQGFRDPEHAAPTMRTFDRALARTGVLQIDSVNVLQRAHFMPLYSRMGPYDVDLLRRASSTPPRRVVEYWAHVAAYMPVDLWPVMRFRMESVRAQRSDEGIAAEKPELVASVLAEVTEGGAATPRDLDAGLPRKKDHWGWNWSETKRALEHLFLVGDLAVAGRNSAFERLYDLPERVIPEEVLARPALSHADAARELVRRAARSHGVGTAGCFKDYYRLRGPVADQAVLDLVDSGELLPARIEGWDRPAYLHVDAARPRRVDARALLSPFDPVVWERERTLRLFDLHYRIEIYVPAHLRTHGYYVLPFLLGDRIVGRVDLKADRKADGGAGRLVVQAAYAEPGAPPDTAAELAAELARLAAWLGLAAAEVVGRGDLAPGLAAELSSYVPTR